MPSARAAMPPTVGRCLRTGREALWQYLRTLPGATRRDAPGVTWVRTDVPVDLTNTMLVVDPAAVSPVDLDAAASFFGRDRPWRVLLPREVPDGIGRALVARGMRARVEEPGMLLEPLPSIRPARRLTIRELPPGRDVAAFAPVWCAAFGIPRWTIPLVLPSVPGDDPVWGARNRFLVGWADGSPVACATVTVTEGVAGIASVGTIPSARGRGYGTEITGAAVEAGRSMGADVAFLFASRMGQPVYERMGFRTVVSMPSWAAPVGPIRTLRYLLRLRRMSRDAARAFSG